MFRRIIFKGESNEIRRSAVLLGVGVFSLVQILFVAEIACLILGANGFSVPGWVTEHLLAVYDLLGISNL